jgi:GNAT superfamily N-acetyltransferase
MRSAPFAPYPLFLLPMTAEAALALASALVGREEQVLAVNGASPATRVCAEELARRAGGEVEVTRATRLHRVDVVRHPDRPEGALRPATVEELDLVLAWFDAFGAAADEQAGRTSGTPHGAMTTREAMVERIGAGQVWLWCDPAGTPVHLSAYQPPAFGVARIAPVFTPPERRGRGYAGATVAALSQRILDEGAVPCLFTDQDNPTSNRLYARLGYVPVADMTDLRIG